MGKWRKDVFDLDDDTTAYFNGSGDLNLELDEPEDDFWGCVVEAKRVPAFAKWLNTMLAQREKDRER